MAKKPTPAESVSPDQALAGRWIAEIGSSEKWQEDWIKRCERIVRRYRNESYTRTTTSVDRDGDTRRFAILWSNIQTLGPAVYARTPQAVVSRRYKDSDPVGRYASEVLERALNFTVDNYDFDDHMKLSRDDYLLLARGQIWVRYVPHVAVQGGEDEQGEDGPQITDTVENEAAEPIYAETCYDHVNYADWGMQPCRSWDETGYVWRRAYYTRSELVERFGALGNKIPLDWSPKEGPLSAPEIKERIKKAAIYEIWDKSTGKVIFLSKAYTSSVLDQIDDPLKLPGFFPCPRPLMGTTPPDNYIPVPDYVYYQDQAEELDKLTQRIDTLSDALRMVGVYAGEHGEKLANMFQGTNNQLIAIPSMASLQEQGGLKGIIEWLPVEQVIETLKGCFEARQQILSDIYQITGISDIVRGASDPQETATAQGIKAQWGSLRVRDRQKEIARFARDLLRLTAEIIAEKFPIQTLKAMTDVKLLTNQEKQQVQMQMQLAQQNPQAAPSPQMMEMMQLPSWEDVNALLKDDALRTFRVEVETDSTIEPDENEEKQRRIEFVEAIGGFLTQSAPLVLGEPRLAPMIGKTVTWLARGFRVGREMEDEIERIFEAIAAQPPQPQQQAAGQSGPHPQELAIKQQDVQTQAQLGMAKIQADQQKTQVNASLDQADLQLRARQQQADELFRTNEQRLKLMALQRDPSPQSVS